MKLTKQQLKTLIKEELKSPSMQMSRTKDDLIAYVIGHLENISQHIENEEYMHAANLVREVSDHLVYNQFRVK